MYDFGEKIVSIKGGWTQCTITFDNGNSMVCYGELMKTGFCIYKKSLKLSPDEIKQLERMIEENAALYENPVKITIE